MESAEAARLKRLSLVAGFCWRYNVRHRELYRRVHDGAIGDLRCVYSTYNASPLDSHPRQPGWSDMEWQLRNWQTFSWLSGDHIAEQAVHSLDRPPATSRLVCTRRGRQRRAIKGSAATLTTACSSTDGARAHIAARRQHTPSTT
jgi:predicted dehydrogenase